VNISSPERRISRLGENTPESTLALGAFSPRRLYPRLGENTFSLGPKTSRLGENSLGSTLATRNHSRLGEMFSPERIMQKTFRQFMQVLLTQSYYKCLR